MKKLTHENIHCASNYRLSITEYESNPERAEHYANDFLRNSIANFIVNKKAEESRDDFYKEYRLDLYVATPSEFWEIVEREAEKIALRFKT